MRQIILDTETTGLKPSEGHRIIEIGCLEMINRKLTGANFHVYINPQREIDAGAVGVHGITNAFLADKPLFSAIANEFVNFIRDAELIIHNAPFDVGFIDHELRLLGLSHSVNSLCRVFDTLPFARRKHPGQPNSLDALCRRYKVDNAHREWHGALLDAELLAKVYLALTGGQGQLFAEEGLALGQDARIFTAGAPIGSSNISAGGAQVNLVDASTQFNSVNPTEQNEDAAVHRVEIAYDLPVILATEEELARHKNMMGEA